MVLSDTELAFLFDLLRLKTTHEPEFQAVHDRCRALVTDYATAQGLRTKVVGPDPYPSLIIGVDPDDLTPSLALSAHLDVVPALPEQYEPQIQGDRLVGRGTSDMKFCVPFFFKALNELDPALKARVHLVFTFDEEIGGNKGTRWLLDEYGYRPRSCFIPDGGDNFKIEYVEKGVLQFRIRTTGKSAHGSRPWLGENAIDKFLAIYADIRKYYAFVSEASNWGPTLNLGKITGGAAANQVPDTCEALLDIRFTEATTLAAVTRDIQAIVGDRGEFSPVVQGDLFYLPPENPVFQMVMEASKAARGEELGLYRSEGASDARFFTRYGIPVVLAKPICAGHHSTYEWMDIPSLTPYHALLLDFTRRAATL